MKPLPFLCFVVLWFVPLDARGVDLSAKETNAPSARMVSTISPLPHAQESSGAEFLRTFHTYALKIDTIYLDRRVIEQAFDKRAEIHAWGLVRTDNPAMADVVIEFNLPALTWQWNFQMMHRPTGLVLGKGMVRALEEYEASELLVQSIVNTIQPERGPVNPQTSSSASSAAATHYGKAWTVKGVGGPLQGQSVNLQVTTEAVHVTGPALVPFDIPTKNILYAYHQVIGDAQRSQDFNEWDKGWDTACAVTQGAPESDSCLAMFGFPLYLLGGFLILAGEPGPAHSVVLRLQEGTSVYELAFLTSTLDWPLLMADLQAVIPGEKKQPLREGKELKKEFEAAKENAVRILLQVPVDVGRWPTLEPGDYKLVINEHGAGRADIFFYKLPTVDFTKPRAVAAAQVAALTPPMPDSKVTFLEKGGLRFFDEVRVGGYLIRFD